jgi:putative ABC transport system permease protein
VKILEKKTNSFAVWISDMGATSGFTNRLEAIPGVGDISTLWFGVTSINGQPVSLLGINPVTYPKVGGMDFKQDDESSYAILTSGRNTIVNGGLMATIPVKIGDAVLLSATHGLQSYIIIANPFDLLNAKIVTGWVSQSNLATDFGRTDDVFIQLYL